MHLFLFSANTRWFSSTRRCICTFNYTPPEDKLNYVLADNGEKSPFLSPFSNPIGTPPPYITKMLGFGTLKLINMSSDIHFSQPPLRLLAKLLAKSKIQSTKKTYQYHLISIIPPRCWTWFQSKTMSLHFSIWGQSTLFLIRHAGNKNVSFSNIAEQNCWLMSQHLSLGLASSATKMTSGICLLSPKF